MSSGGKKIKQKAQIEIAQDKGGCALKKTWSGFIIAAVLVVLSVVFFIIQNTIFHQPEEAVFLFFQDLAFLPLQALLVTFVLESVIETREKRERLEQINVLISAFFSEIGLDAIKALKPFIVNMQGVADCVDIKPTWRDIDFKTAAKDASLYKFEADSNLSDLESLRQVLYWKKDNVLAMFQNPNLLENNKFTSMLWALYHLLDELSSRNGYISLPETDLDHISTDLERAYKLLLIEWIYYMKHLKSKYPYLFSLAIRKNPFKDKDSVVIY